MCLLWERHSVFLVAIITFITNKKSVGILYANYVVASSRHKLGNHGGNKGVHNYYE